MAEDGGVEPHPISENLVFKASRRTIPPALSSKLTLGTLAQIRTERTSPFERDDFTNLSTRALVGPVGIEPTSIALQATAMTTLAKVPF